VDRWLDILFVQIGRIPFNLQIEYFQNTQAQFQQLLGAIAAAQVFPKAIYSVTLGSNDYINNYLLTDSATSITYTPQQFQDLLIATYSTQLTVRFNA
jgi:hypothetical protein